MEIISKSIQETYAVAAKLAQEILLQKKPNLVLLEADLGGGKTTFSQGFIQSLGITQAVTSPTFVIMKSYKVPNSKFTIYHLDLYRLNQEWEVLDLGIIDILNNPENILLVEWSNKTPGLWHNLPYILIQMEVLNATDRAIKIKESKL